jgi:LacI family transcriptional regulator
MVDPWASLPTSHDVARKARVSQSTVSRALRGDPRVSDETRARVESAAKRLGYVRSERGRSLSTRRTNRVGVVVEDLENPFYLDLVNILHQELERVDLRPIIFTAERTKGEGIERLVDGSIDGAILTTCSLGSALPMALRSFGFPLVLLNRVIDSGSVSSCSTDNQLGATLMSTEVVDYGHRVIGAIFGPRDTSTGRDREVGVRATLQSRGIPLRKGLTWRGPFSYESGHRGLRHIASAPNPPSCVICGNDVVAIGAMNAARSLGLRVPEDISIVGFDDIGMSAWEMFDLTTVRQDMRRMAEVGIGLLSCSISSPIAPVQQVVLVPELVQRSTLGPPKT